MEEPVHRFKTNTSRIANGFVIFVLSVFGLMFLLGGWDKIFHKQFPSLDFFQYLFFIVLGMFLFFVAIRLAMSAFLATVSITPDSIVLFRFWKPRTKWRFADVLYFEIETQSHEQLKTRVSGSGTMSLTGTGRMLHSEVLTAHFRDGTEQSVRLPNFKGANEKLLMALGECGKREIRRQRIQSPT